MLRSVCIVLVSDQTHTIEDSNKTYNFLIMQLKLLNYEVQKLVDISEDELVLIRELNNLVQQYDVLIVIGELKNDIIFKSLGKLASDVLKPNDILRRVTKQDDLAKLPSVAKLLTNDNLPYPVIYLQRIFILKKEFVEIQFFNVLKFHLEQYIAPPIFKKKLQVHTNGNTKKILDLINKLVTIETQKEDDNLVLNISSCNFENIVEAERMLNDKLHGYFLESNEDEDLLKQIYNGNDEHLCKSIEVIQNCISTYGPENVFLSFNGGKDCTVLLHLIHTVLKINYPDFKKPICCMYVKSREPFPEQDLFISHCQIFYNLDITVINSGIKEALEQVLTTKRNLKACFMGTRKTDPYSEKLCYFQMTDPDWPQVMRVSPLLEWHYSDIWDYLLFYKIPYCKLYDAGFTSLGNSSNTIRNPSLIYRDPKLDTDVYLPAYKLLKESEERTGRNVTNN